MYINYRVKVPNTEGEIGVSQRQGCPLWSGIWRKLEAKFRSEGHESHKEATAVGRVCITKRNPNHPKAVGVDVADTWNES